jgi:hypothetical protein
VQIFVLRSAAQPASGPPVGIHLFPVTAARHRAGTARVLLGGFPPLLRRSVLVLSAYATKMDRSLVPAILQNFFVTEQMYTFRYTITYLQEETISGLENIGFIREGCVETTGSPYNS